MIINSPNYTVYVHINKINGKIYVGLTGQDVKKRWNNGNLLEIAKNTRDFSHGMNLRYIC